MPLDLGRAEMVALGIKEADLVPGIAKRTAEAEEAQRNLMADPARSEREIGRIDEKDSDRRPRADLATLD